ncbi:MAG: hypothetical protein Q7V88_02655 [Actinomycetota bacterium]|nr:hypothetical protein [Actinomycetota bacterium]
MSTNDDPAERLMEKVKQFNESLAADERALFAALIAPGIARALAPDDEVEGYGLTEWMPTSLPEQLTEQIRTSNITVNGL